MMIFLLFGMFYDWKFRNIIEFDDYGIFLIGLIGVVYGGFVSGFEYNFFVWFFFDLCNLFLFFEFLIKFCFGNVVCEMNMCFM